MRVFISVDIYSIYGRLFRRHSRDNRGKIKWVGLPIVSSRGGGFPWTWSWMQWVWGTLETGFCGSPHARNKAVLAGLAGAVGPGRAGNFAGLGARLAGNGRGRPLACVITLCVARQLLGFCESQLARRHHNPLPLPLPPLPPRPPRHPPPRPHTHTHTFGGWVGDGMSPVAGAGGCAAQVVEGSGEARSSRGTPPLPCVLPPPPPYYPGARLYYPLPGRGRFR